MRRGDDGGALVISNKEGDPIIQASADDFGHGYIGVFDRNGNGRMLKPR